ncbi:hypothetical protein T492DRAFT_320572, partial [Pavlovales sp. CCMP2436]
PYLSPPRTFRVDLFLFLFLSSQDRFAQVARLTDEQFRALALERHERASATDVDTALSPPPPQPRQSTAHSRPASSRGADVAPPRPPPGRPASARGVAPDPYSNGIGRNNGIGNGQYYDMDANAKAVGSRRGPGGGRGRNGTPPPPPGPPPESSLAPGLANLFGLASLADHGPPTYLPAAAYSAPATSMRGRGRGRSTRPESARESARDVWADPSVHEQLPVQVASTRGRGRGGPSRGPASGLFAAIRAAAADVSTAALPAAVAGQLDGDGRGGARAVRVRGRGGGLARSNGSRSLWEP